MTIYSLDILLSNLEPVCCSMSSSNCRFLTCIQISQEAGRVVWYSHLFKSFPQFVVISTVKSFRIANEAEVNGFLIAFSMIQQMLTVWSLGQEDPLEKEMATTPVLLTCLLRNLYAGQEATVRTGHGTTDWFQIGKGVHIKAVYCHPAYLTYMQSTSCKMPGWMKHKLESRLPGEISIISDMQLSWPRGLVACQSPLAMGFPR